MPGAANGSVVIGGSGARRWTRLHAAEQAAAGGSNTSRSAAAWGSGYDKRVVDWWVLLVGEFGGERGGRPLPGWRVGGWVPMLAVGRAKGCLF